MIDNQETQEKIAAEVRDLSKFVRNKVELGEYIDVPMPTAFGKPLDVYYAELADRIEAAARRDYEYPKAQSLDADKLTGKNISGLVTDLRQIAKYHYARGNIEQGQFARVMSDRIEAAQKREVDVLKRRIYVLNVYAAVKDKVIMRLNDAFAEERRRMMATTEDSSAVGNAAAMRAALESVSKAFDDGLICTDFQMSDEDLDRFDAIYHQVKDALAEPPRNCNIGTAEEQAERFIKFCVAQDCHRNCPCSKKKNMNECIMSWAQMPYESEVAE